MDEHERHRREPETVRVVLDIGPQFRWLLFRIIDAITSHDADDAAAARALSVQVKADTQKLADATAASTRP